MGRRTNLSRARDQISALFDRAERALGPQRDDPEVVRAKARAASAARRESSRRVLPSAAAAREAFGSAAGLIGLALGLGLSYLPQAKKLVTDAESAAWGWVVKAGKSIQTHVDDAQRAVQTRVDEAKTGIADAWHWMSGLGSKFVDDATTWLGERYHATQRWVSGVLEDVGAHVHEWRDDVTRSIHDALVPTPDDTKPPEGDAKMPEGVEARLNRAVRDFWRNIAATLKRWLWSAWEKATGDTASAAEAGGFVQPGSAGANIHDAAFRGGRGPGDVSDATRPGGGAGRHYDHGSGSTKAHGNLAKNQQIAYKAFLADGRSPMAARAMVANMSGESLANTHDKHWDVKHFAHGGASWDDERSAAIRKQFGKNPEEMDAAETAHAMNWEVNTNKRFAKTKAALEGDDPGAMMDQLVGNFEVPGDVPGQIVKRMGIYRGFKEEADAPSKPPEAAAKPPEAKAKPPEATAKPAPAARMRPGGTDHSTPDPQTGLSDDDFDGDDEAAPKARATAAPEPTPTPATTAPPLQPEDPPPAPAPAAGASGGDEDHGWHPRRQPTPHAVSTESGLIIIAASSYA